MSFKKEYMFLVIILIALFHWIMALLWIAFKRVSVYTDSTSDKRIFERCKYPIFYLIL